MYTVFNIAAILEAEWLQQKEDAAIAHILVDSRRLLFPSTSIFFALDGPRISGASFFKELYDKGVRSFVTGWHMDAAELKLYPLANFLRVKNVLGALQKLVAFHRAQFTIPIVGVTGSNGKTIVKEWLYQLLHTEYDIVRSPKSYNSQTGVPLSVWQISDNNSLGIFEAGISQPGEMQQLQNIIQPTIGIFTNIGQAHAEGFLNIQQKIQEKLLLFADSEVLIFKSDDSNIAGSINALTPSSGKLTIFDWGTNAHAKLQVLSVEKSTASTTISARFFSAPGENRLVTITIPFTDEASAENAITCWCLLLYLQQSDGFITERMLQLRPVEMRLELKQGINNCSIINDSYSADINSLNIALDFLSNQQQHGNRTIILSDILQTGKNSKDLYEEVAFILQQKNVTRFIGIGAEINLHQQAFKNITETIFFNTTNDFKTNFYSLHFYNETILLKGARVFGFEQISLLLEEKTHQTVLEINLNAVTYNLKQYQQLLNPGVKIMAMVKAFSYGSGSFEIANLLQFNKADYLAVAYADEGVELRKAGISLPIMVMNAEEITYGQLVEYNLEPEIFSFTILETFKTYLGQQGLVNYPVHIKLDTGMHRLGFEPGDINKLALLLQKSTFFKIQSVFTHLAASDAAGHDGFTEMQAEAFLSCCAVLQNALPYQFIRHIGNTSAIHRHKNLQLDMVRLGIGLYGVDGTPAMQQRLQNVTTLKTTISQIKHVKAGETVGYNRKGIVYKDSIIATIRIGYADGYPRALSNGKGKMFVKGRMVPVIGLVCMDMTMVDITGTSIEEGDEVIVFGKQLSVHDVAGWADTIPYEILTGISQRVKRVYFEE